MANTINTLLGIIAGLITIVSAYYLVLKYCFAPKFIIGVLDLDAATHGDVSESDEVYFDETVLAKKVRALDLEMVFKDLRSRSFQMNSEIILPIIIQNVGLREAERYKIAVSFSDDRVMIADIHFETLSFDSIYSHNGNKLARHLQKKNAPEEIRAIYDKMGLRGDYFSVIGSMASQAFEMILLKISVPSEMKFDIHFRIDSPSIFSRRQHFVQTVNVMDLDDEKKSTYKQPKL